jgi:hypothetical protein
VYFDNKPCRVCGSEVRLEAHDGRPPSEERDPDGTVDVRVCTNPDCATHRDSREP